MTDSDLRKRFIRQKAVGRSVHVLVCVISWNGPSTPISRWKVAAKINAAGSGDKLDSAITHILRDEQYFGVCKECGERNPCGWMHGLEICQSCAEANHGVVH